MGVWCFTHRHFWRVCPPPPPLLGGGWGSPPPPSLWAGVWCFTPQLLAGGCCSWALQTSPGLQEPWWCWDGASPHNRGCSSGFPLGHPLDLPITQCPSGMPGLTDGNLSGEGPEVPRSSLSPHPPARSPPRVVWCDMDTEGKGWTVVQRNSHDTELTWKQSWTTYKYGFGNVHSDYWLGTEYLHLLTQQGTYKVRFVVRDKANVTHYAEYDIFRVENEASGYPLRLGRHSGDGDDYLTLYHPKKGGIHDNMKFSTVDKDQDQYSGNCAKSYGGWWYNRCQNVLLNAKNYIVWPGFCDKGDCASSLILVKPTDVC
uniref:Uncharacterized protein n=1 Tax=Geospiza parvula TaxID=87175 RepID=A0A8U8B640_GEOPR